MNLAGWQATLRRCRSAGIRRAADCRRIVGVSGVVSAKTPWPRPGTNLPPAIWQELRPCSSPFSESNRSAWCTAIFIAAISCAWRTVTGHHRLSGCRAGAHDFTTPSRYSRTATSAGRRDDQLRWLDAYREQLATQGVDISDDAQSFARQFDLVGLQRHLRVLGVFARLCLRDQKPDYLNDLPLVLDYVREALARYEAEPAIGAFSDWFERTVMPKIASQHWYSDQRTDAR